MAEWRKLEGVERELFSMGWKIWGVVLITELFLFLFFKPTADCGRLRYGWLFIVRPSGLQLLLLFVYAC